MFHYLHAYLCVHFFDIIVQFICIYCLLKSEIYLHDITVFNFHGDKQMVINKYKFKPCFGKNSILKNKSSKNKFYNISITVIKYMKNAIKESNFFEIF